MNNMATKTNPAAFFVLQEVLDDGTIRIIFKTYFIVMLIFIGLIGNRCCRLLVKHKLLKNHIVLLTSTTGWIQGPPYIKIFWQLRKMPGGGLGWLMLLATILDLVGEYSVSKEVTEYFALMWDKPLVGMILTGASNTSVPDINWEAYRYASNAQFYSFYNANISGLDDRDPHYGIYQIVKNDPRFIADSDVEIGYWKCDLTTPQPVIYNRSSTAFADEILDEDIYYDLAERDLLFSENNYYYYNVSKYDNYNNAVGPASHTTIISFGSPSTGDVFEIKAAVDTWDIDDLGSKQMETFACELISLEPDELVKTIARQIDIDATLEKWIDEIVGSMFPGLHEDRSYSTDYIERKLQQYLNSMIMVAGSDESVTTPNDRGYEIGIVTVATIIPYWVVVICGVVGLLATFLVCYAIYLWFANRAAARTYDRSSREACKVESGEIQNAPVGMLEWMTHAAYESRDADRIPQRKHLKNWMLSTTWHAGRRPGIVRVGELGQVNPLRTSGLTTSTPSLYGQQYQPYQGHEMGYFPAQKGDYISVNTREVS